MTAVSKPSSTYQESRLPLQFRVLNWAGDRLKLNALPALDLKENSLLEAAQNQSGLYDWGDESFLVPFRLLLKSFNTEANLNTIGRYFLRQYCIRLLINRLRLQDDFKRHPEIFQVPIERPLFVVGLFRSGTTFLHNLLSSDPASRWLHVAEVLNPSPPPERETWHNDPRIKEAEKLLEFQDSLAPKYSTALAIDANRPAECARLFEHGFIGHQFDFRANVKTYSEWLEKQDLVDAYRYYRQQLQYLGWRWSENHWVLKSPPHLYTLDALLTVFPDACIVHIHRDPLKVLPSCCSLSSMGRARFSDRVELQGVGSHWVNQFTNGIDRAIKDREKADPKRFYDVNYVDFIKEPLKTIRQIYDYFGYEFSDRVEESVKKCIEANPQHKRGVHRYTLEQFGLDSAEVTRRFANYYEKFNVTKEK